MRNAFFDVFFINLFMGLGEVLGDVFVSFVGISRATLGVFLGFQDMSRGGKLIRTYQIAVTLLRTT